MSNEVSPVRGLVLDDDVQFAPLAIDMNPQNTAALMNATLKHDQAANSQASALAMSLAGALNLGPVAPSNYSGKRKLETVLGPTKPRIDNEEHYRRIKYAMGLDIPSMADIAGKYRGETVLLVGGGPSLKETYGDVMEAASRGAKICALNKSHDAMIHGFHDGKRQWPGFVPHFAFMLDPAPHCVGYQTHHPMCTYLYGTTCDPQVFQKGMEASADMYLFVPTAENPVKEIARMEAEFPNDMCYIMGGTTSGTRAVNAFGHLGFSVVECHGFDSCLPPGAGADDIMGNQQEIDMHALYAYAKPHVEDQVWDYTAVARSDGAKLRFISNHAMARQVKVWGSLVESLPNLEFDGRIGQMSLRVAGDGVIPWMVWKDADMPNGLYCRHATPERMEAKYGRSRAWDFVNNREQCA